MPAYLKFYALARSPFDGDTQSKVVLGTKALRDALAEIRSGLEEGAARICVNGQAGLGKTSLARALPKLLEAPIRVAVILDPTSPWDAIRKSVAKQWRVGEGGLARSNLVSFSDDTRFVLVLDQAERAPTDTLDHLDVMLSYRSERDEPVVQSVLFANLSTGEGTEPPPLIWWLDRIQTLELQFAPLPRDGVASYIEKHLKRAGWKEGSLFSADAAHAIHGYTSGIPGEIDRVCDELLRRSAERNIRTISADLVHEILDEHVEFEEQVEVEQEQAEQRVDLPPFEAESDRFENRFEDLVREDEFAGAENVDTRNHEPDAAVPATVLEMPDESEVTSGEMLLDVLADSVSEEEKAETEAEATHDVREDVTAGAAVLELVDSLDPDQLDDEEAHADGDFDSQDASLIELEAYLSQPPTEDELREIARGGFAQFGRMAAAVVLAVALGSMTLIWISGEKKDSIAASEARAKGRELPESIANPTLFSGPEGLSPDAPESRILARLRGPLVEPNAGPGFGDEPTPSNSNPEQRSADLSLDPLPAAPAGFEAEPDSH